MWGDPNCIPEAQPQHRNHTWTVQNTAVSQGPVLSTTVLDLKKKTIVFCLFYKVVGENSIMSTKYLKIMEKKSKELKK